MSRPALRATDALPDILPPGVLAGVRPRLAPPLPDRDPPPHLVEDVRLRALADGASPEEADERAARYAARWRDRWRWSGRVCSTCKTRKPLDAYGFDPRTFDACKHACRECLATAARERRARKQAEAAATA